MESLKASDAAAAAAQKTPNRVTRESMLAKIQHEQFINPASQPTVTICVMTLANGFVLVGKSAPADPENFDPDLGAELAREDCIRQMWPLEGYLLRERLSGLSDRAP